MSKNGAIVYYSWIGNTKVVANEIQRATGFDLLPIQEVKQRELGKIMGPAMCAFLGFKSQIKPMDLNLQKAEDVFLGTPVWGGKTPPAVNKYLSKVDLKGKNVWLFITQGDDKIPQAVIDSITKRVEKKGGKVVDHLIVTTKWDPKVNQPMAIEDMGSDIKNWVDKYLNA